MLQASAWGIMQDLKGQTEEPGPSGGGGVPHVHAGKQKPFQGSKKLLVDPLGVHVCLGRLLIKS